LPLPLFLLEEAKDWADFSEPFSPFLRPFGCKKCNNIYFHFFDCPRTLFISSTADVRCATGIGLTSTVGSSAVPLASRRW
jgi:hypothetical protein